MNFFLLVMLIGLFLFLSACATQTPDLVEEETFDVSELVESGEYILIDKLKTPQNVTNLTTTDDTLNHLGSFLNETQ